MALRRAIAASVLALAIVLPSAGWAPVAQATDAGSVREMDPGFILSEASVYSLPRYGAWLPAGEPESNGVPPHWRVTCPACGGMDRLAVGYAHTTAMTATLAGARDDGAGPPAPAPSISQATLSVGASLALFGAYVAAGDLDGDGTSELITGPDAGGGPHVKVFRHDGSDTGVGIMAYDAAFTGGVRVAACDVDGDGTAEIVTGPGPSGGAHVKVFEMVGRALVERLGFLAYDPAFSGGVYVGCADLDGDGRGDLIVGAGAGGGPHVRAFRVIGTSVVELLSFHAFDPAFRGGVRVTAGDVDGDGVAEIIVGAGPGGGPHVRVFAMTDDVPRELSSFLAYHPSFAGGVFVAAGPVWDDGRVGIVTGADAGGGPHVRAFSGAGHDIGADFLAYNPLFAGGVRVAIVSVTGAAYEILTVAGPGCTATVRRFFASGVSAGADLVAY